MTDVFELVPFFNILAFCWGLGLCVHVGLFWTLHQNLRDCFLTLSGVGCSLRCFRLCVHLQLQTVSLLGWFRATVTFIAQISHVLEPLHQALHKFCRTRLRTLVETGHREDYVIWLRVIASSVSIWNHRPITAEHLYSGWNLRKKLKLQFCTNDKFNHDVIVLGSGGEMYEKAPKEGQGGSRWSTKST